MAVTTTMSSPSRQYVTFTKRPPNVLNAFFLSLMASCSMSGSAIVDFTSASAIFRHFICLWACLLIMILMKGVESWFSMQWPRITTKLWDRRHIKVKQENEGMKEQVIPQTEPPRKKLPRRPVFSDSLPVHGNPGWVPLTPVNRGCLHRSVSSQYASRSSNPCKYGKCPYMTEIYFRLKIVAPFSKISRAKPCLSASCLGVKPIGSSGTLNLWCARLKISWRSKISSFTNAGDTTATSISLYSIIIRRMG